jgi:hypothetical protein
MARSAGLEPTASASPPKADSIRTGEDVFELLPPSACLEEALPGERRAFGVELFPVNQAPWPARTRPAIESSIVLGNSHLCTASGAPGIPLADSILQHVDVPGSI